MNYGYRVGDRVVTPRLGTCVVLRVRPCGTIDVRATDGRHYRVSGLSPARKEQVTDSQRSALERSPRVTS